MKTQLSMRWIIGLFLLTALFGITAVTVQGQGPVGQAPVAMEVGESTPNIPWVNTEVEPNNSPGQARDGDADGGINGGVISGNDVDYWRIGQKFDTPEAWYCEFDDGCMFRDHEAVLIDIEAQSIGSGLDAVICLHSDDGFVLACNDNTDTVDPMLYYNLEAHLGLSGANHVAVYRDYYVSVRRVSGSGSYQLLVSYPLLVSAAAANLGTGYVDGIPIQAGDVLAFSEFRYQNTHYEKWVMLLDLSDLGVKGNLTNLAAGWRNSDYLLVGFAANITLPGIGRKVTPWEVVIFDPTTIGPRTEGVFSLWWDGRSQALTTSAEKIDAIDWPDWNGYTRLYLSTTGTASVYGGPGTTLKLPDEDIGMWMDGPPDEFYPLWARSFDTSAVTGWGQEEVVAFSYLFNYMQFEGYDYTGDYVVVVQGSAKCPVFSWDNGYFEGGGEIVTQKDIVTLVTLDVWWSPEGGVICDAIWHGPDHGWNYNIDAIEYPHGEGRW